MSVKTLKGFTAYIVESEPLENRLYGLNAQHKQNK